MKHIVEYKLWGGKTPFFIEDGGYFPKEGTLIGITKDDYDCYIPSDIVILTKEDLEVRITSMEYKEIDKDNKEKISTTQEKIDLINDWLNLREIK